MDADRTPLGAGAHDRAAPGPRAAAALVAATTLLVAGFVALVLVGAGEPSAPVRDHGGVAFDVGAPPADVAALYRFAASHDRHLSEVPCFCGCESFLAHRGLADCFLQPDGAWEPHAAGCGICVAEAVSVRTSLAAGESVAAARERVVATFGSTPGTSSPAPATHEERIDGT